MFGKLMKGMSGVAHSMAGGTGPARGGAAPATPTTAGRGLGARIGARMRAGAQSRPATPKSSGGGFGRMRSRMASRKMSGGSGRY